MKNLKNLKNLKSILCGGEAFTPSILHDFQKIYPKVKIINVYGPTEATIHVTAWNSHSDKYPDTADCLPLGYPIANASLYILNEDLNPCAIWQHWEK